MDRQYRSRGTRGQAAGLDTKVQAQRADGQVAGLKMLRERARLTQLELAEGSGVSTATIGRVESGRHAPGGDTLRLLAAALRVLPQELSVERLLEGKRRPVVATATYKAKQPPRVRQ